MRRLQNGAEVVNHRLIPTGLTEGDIQLGQAPARQWHYFPSEGANFVRIQVFKDERVLMQKDSDFFIADVIRIQLKKCFMKSGSHFVDHLKIGSGVLRIPEGLKFHAHRLSVQDMSTLPKIQPILANIPMLVLKAELPTDPILFNEDVRSYESLRLELPDCSPLVHWTPVICSLTNKELYISGTVIVKEPYLDILKEWVKIPRGIGSKLSIEAFCAEAHLAMIEQSLGAVRAKIPGKYHHKYPHGLRRELNSSISELCFYVGHASGDALTGINQPDILTMEVMEKGSADEIEFFSKGTIIFF